MSPICTKSIFPVAFSTAIDPSATFMFSIRYMARGFNKFRELTIGHLLMAIM